ncbi:MAG: hypothetical protein U5K54_23805 [Cytophagales bacterium]|nr:hypothetical protein [Cytophagales bacterium]
MIIRLHDTTCCRKNLPCRELQRLYETILGEPLDRRNFQKRMLGLEILKKLRETKLGGAHKAPFLYRFDKRKYQKALKQGFKSSW